jgi:hypothetical protein
VPAAPVVSEIAVARRPERVAKADSRPVKILMSGEPALYDLRQRADRSTLIRDVNAGSIDDLVAAYRTVSTAARANPSNADLRDLSVLLASSAKQRGVQAGNGLPHLDPLADFRRPDEPLHSNLILAPDRGEPDIRPFLQASESFETDRIKALRRLIRGFGLNPLEAVWDSLWAARERAGLDESLRYPVTIAIGFLQSWAYRWRDRLGANRFPPDTPGLYRKESLSLFPDARTLVRIAEQAPGQGADSQLTMPSSATVQAPVQRSTDVSEQSRRPSRAELLQQLEQRRAATMRRRDAATGDMRILLTIKVAAIEMEIDTVGRGIGQAAGPAAVANSANNKPAHNTEPPESVRSPLSAAGTALAGPNAKPAEPSSPENQSTREPKRVPRPPRGRVPLER